MSAAKVHKILSDFNQIQRITKSHVNEIKYYGQHSPGTSRLTSLFQRRKTAVVLANPVVRWKNKKHKAKPKSKSRKRRIKYAKGETKQISVLPRFQQQQGMISITTSQAYDDYFPQQSYST